MLGSTSETQSQIGNTHIPVVGIWFEYTSIVNLGDLYKLTGVSRGNSEPLSIKIETTSKG